MKSNADESGGMEMFMDRQMNKLLEGPIWKPLLGFFFPCWLGMLFQQLYNTVDTLVVGNFVGTDAVAAVGNVSFIVQLVIGLCTGIASGAGVVISQHYGAGRHDQVKVNVHGSLKIACVSGILFTVVGVWMADLAIRWMNTPEDILEESSVYLKVYFCALLPNMIYNFGTAILRGIGDSRRPLYVLIAASVVNIVLDLLFVVVFKWGVFGVALATDIAQIVSAVLVLILLVRAMPELREGRKRAPGVYGSIFKVGIPAALQNVMYASSNVVIQTAVNSFGTAVIAAWTIYGKIDCVFWMTVSSMGMAVTAFAGQNFGAQKYDRVKRGTWVANGMLGGSTVVIIVLLYAGVEILFRVFTPDSEVVEIGVSMVRFLVPAYLLYFPIETISGALRGCGDVVVPTIASVVGICLVRVLWIWRVVPLYPTMETVMMSYVVTWGLVAAFHIIYFLRGKWLGRCIAR